MDVMVEMKKIDEAMSPFVSSSQLSELNRFASSRPVEVSAELFELINESVKLAELTHDAFDITFASMDHSLNFREGAKENDAVLAVALSGIDYTSISLDEENHQVKFLRSGIHIGLSRVANGYAVDKGIEILRYHGITQTMVGVGGDSRVIGNIQYNRHNIAVRHPQDPEAMLYVLPFSDSSVSTAGD